MPTKKYPWEQLPNYAGAPVLPDMPNRPGAINLPDLPEYGQIPDAPTLGDMPTMPDMYTLPDMPDMYTLPDMPERGAIPEIPDAMRALYEESPETMAAYQNYLASVGQKPSDYSSQYLPQMDAIMQKYGSQAPFNYDINGDMLYQQMKDQYIRNGQRAMMDAQGQASAMTGGYGSTYAQGVGQQQYNQYLEALNNNIPALYDRQYQQYRDQRGDLLNQFNMAGTLENTNYGRYRDTVGDWKDETSRTYGEFMDSRSFGYNKYLNEIQQAGTVYNKELDNFWNQYNDDMNRYGIKKEDVMNTYAQMMARYGEDKVDIQNVYNELMNRYDTNLSNIWDVYGANVDQVNAYNQNTDLGYRNALGQAEMLNSDTWNRYNSEMSQYSQSLQNIWNDIDYQNSLVDQQRGDLSAAQKEARTLAEVYFAKGKMPPEDILQAAGIDAETAKLLIAQGTPMTGGSSGGSRGGGSSNLKKLTDDGWSSLQAAFDAGGPDALLAEAERLRKLGYDPGPALDQIERDSLPAWEANQKALRDSNNHTNKVMSNLNPTVIKAVNPNLDKVIADMVYKNPALATYAPKPTTPTVNNQIDETLKRLQGLTYGLKSGLK